MWTASSGIEEVGQPDSLGLGHQPEKRTIAVEAPRAALGDDFDGGLAVAVKKLVRRPSRSVLVREIDGHVADPLDVDDRDELVRQDSLNGGPRVNSSSFAMLTALTLHRSIADAARQPRSVQRGVSSFMTVF